jgi:proteasome accessory factor B
MTVTTSTQSRKTRLEGEESRVSTAGGKSQLARLMRLVLLLQTERFPNARDLAERCEVSTRTIYRDIEILTRAGIPVSYRQEREGYQLSRGVALPPTGVDETEALALLVLARQWKGGDGLGLFRHVWSGAVKVVQSLSPEVRERVLSAVEGFDAVSERAAIPNARQAIHETILSSLASQRQLRMWYRDARSLADECTKFSLYRLLLHERHWYLLGRSSLHRRVEVIGVPWIQRAVLTDDAYVIPPRFSLDRHLGHAWGVGRDRVRYFVWLRFSRRVAPELNDIIWHPTERRVELADGRVDLQVLVDGIDEILRWVLGFGDQVEVIAPAELSVALFRVATNVARRHRPPRTAGTVSPTARDVESGHRPAEREAGAGAAAGQGERLTLETLRLE